MRQHTPGSWTVDDKRALFNVRAKVTQNGFENPIVCELYDDFCTDEEAQANANLIAASPTLLAACKAAYEWSQSIGKARSEYNFAFKVLPTLELALAKAEGRE